MLASLEVFYDYLFFVVANMEMVLKLRTAVSELYLTSLDRCVDYLLELSILSLRCYKLGRSAAVRIV
jgi:hypothetical protein